MACFWTDLVKADQDCGGGGSMFADFYAEALYGSLFIPFADCVWAASPLYTPPSLPLTYAGSVTKDMFPATRTVISATDYNAVDISAGISMPAEDRIYTPSPLSMPAHSTGSGNKSIVFYLEVSGGAYASLGADYTRTSSLYSVDPNGFLTNRVAASSVDGALEVMCAELTTSASASVNLANGTASVVVGASLSGTYTYSGTFSGLELNSYYSPVTQEGLIPSVQIQVSIQSGGVVSANPVTASFDLTDLSIDIAPLRKIVAYVQDVVFFSDEDATPFDGTMEYPDLSEGTAYSKRIALIDNPDYSDYVFVGPHYNDPEISPGGSPFGLYVGDLVDADSPSTVLAKVKIRVYSGA